MTGSISTILRWKAFRLASRFLLGKTFGEAMLGTSASLDVEDDVVLSDLRAHVRERRRISGPETVFYRYSDAAPDYFREASVYGTKSAWLLSDVFVSPKHGASWTPEGRLLQESVTNLATFYLFGGPAETALRSAVDGGTTPLVPLRSNLVYYHTLLDDIPQLLHALDFCPEARILLAAKHPAYIDGILEFLGIDRSRIVLSDRPVRVRSCVFVPKQTRTSFIRPCDLSRLRQAVLPRIRDAGSARRLYVSRRGTPLRAFENERDLESALASAGFDVLRFEDLAFADQMAAVRSAGVVVAPHGSGLANLVAAREGTRVVEIMHPGWIRSTFPRLSSQLSLDHRLVLAETDRIPLETVLRHLEDLP